MQDYIIKVLVEYVLRNLTPEKIQSLVDKLKLYILPKLHLASDEFIALLRSEAAKTKSIWDDKAVDVLEQFLNAFLQK